MFPNEPDDDAEQASSFSSLFHAPAPQAQQVPASFVDQHDRHGSAPFLQSQSWQSHQGHASNGGIVSASPTHASQLAMELFTSHPNPRIVAGTGGTASLSVTQQTGISVVLVPGLNGTWILGQYEYKRGRPGDARIPTMVFPSVNLRQAIREEYRDESLAWSSAVTVPQKLAIVLCLPGCDEYTRQVHVLRTHQKSPTRAKLAFLVAREVEAFLLKQAEGGKTLFVAFGGQRQQLTLDHLVLLEVRHVSKGSLQPTIGLVRL